MEQVPASELNIGLHEGALAKEPPKDLIVGRYEVVQTLSGGMGLVHLCRDHVEGRPVALKTFKPEFLSHVGARDLFLREGTMWVQIGRHPHIVRAHRVERTANGLEVYLVLSWIVQPPGKDSPSLRSWLKMGQPLSMKEALTFALHITRGMKFATSQLPGLVHRDLKPENVLIGHDGNARVTDFGLASTLSEMKAGHRLASLPNVRDSMGRTQLTQGVAGTPLYMAPEQWLKQKVDARADIYALGCIFYEMITGRLAAEGDTREKLQEIHLSGRIKPPPGNTPATAVAFLRQCIMLKPEQRFRNWHHVEDALMRVYWAILQEEPPSEVLRDEDTREERLAAGDSYNAMGLSYLDIGKLSVAVMYFEQAVWISRAEKSLALEGKALGNLGLAYKALGYISRSIEFQEEHLAIARELEDLAEEGRALGDLGQAYRQLGDFKRAIAYHNRQLSIAQGLNDRFREATALYNLGETYRHLKNRDEAVKYYQLSLGIARATGDRGRLKSVLSSMGHIYLESGEPKEAAALFHQSLEMSRSIADKVGEAKSFSDLGHLYKRLGYGDRSVEFYNHALRIANESHDLRQKANIMTNLGDIYFEMQDVRRAKEFYEGALTAVQEVSDQINEMKLFNKLGIIWAMLRDFMEAASYHRRAMLLARDLKDRAVEEGSLFHLAKAYEGWGDWGRAAEYYDEHLELSRARGDWQKEIDVLLAKANLHHKWRQAGTARKVGQQALEVAQNWEDGSAVGKVWNYLGDLENKLGDIKQAAEYYKEAVEVAEESGNLPAQAVALSNLGMAYHVMGRRWQAGRSVERAYKLARQANDETSMMWASYSWGKFLYDQEKWAKARPFIEQAEQLFAKFQLQSQVEEMQRIRVELDRHQYSS